MSSAQCWTSFSINSFWSGTFLGGLCWFFNIQSAFFLKDSICKAFLFLLFLLSLCFGTLSSLQTWNQEDNTLPQTRIGITTLTVLCKAGFLTLNHILIGRRRICLQICPNRIMIEKGREEKEQVIFSSFILPCIFSRSAVPVKAFYRSIHRICGLIITILRTTQAHMKLD